MTTNNQSVRRQVANVELEVPGDVHEAMTANGDAASRFRVLPLSHKREYLQWISEAKKPETRTKRIGQMIEMLTKV